MQPNTFRLESNDSITQIMPGVPENYNESTANHVLDDDSELH